MYHGGGYVEQVDGTVDQQYNRVFSQAGMYGSNPSNVLIGAQGQNASFAHGPSAQNLALIQQAGSRRRWRRYPSRRRPRRQQYRSRSRSRYRSRR